MELFIESFSWKTFPNFFKIEKIIEFLLEIPYFMAICSCLGSQTWIPISALEHLNIWLWTLFDPLMPFQKITYLPLLTKCLKDQIQFFRIYVRNHIVRCWNAMILRKDLPEMPAEEEKFKKKVSFFETTTESISQFTLSSVIFRVYGVSDSTLTKFFQIFSICTSSLSLTITFISVSIKRKTHLWSLIWILIANL